MSILMTRVLARRGEKRCLEAQTLPVSRSVSRSVSIQKKTNKHFFCSFLLLCQMKWICIRCLKSNAHLLLAIVMNWTWMMNVFWAFFVFYCFFLFRHKKQKQKQGQTEQKKKIEPHCLFVIVFGIRSNKTTQHFWGTLDWKQLVSTR